jgi:hypothetical protein
VKGEKDEKKATLINWKGRPNGQGQENTREEEAATRERTREARSQGQEQSGTVRNGQEQTAATGAQVAENRRKKKNRQQATASGAK